MKKPINSTKSSILAITTTKTTIKTLRRDRGALSNFVALFILVLLLLFISCDDTLGDSSASLEEIVTSGTLPSGVSTSSILLVANTLGRVGGEVGAKIEAIYVTESGSGNFSGSSWDNAQRGTDLRNLINNISDATADKVYVVLVGAGVYKPTTGTDRTIHFSMKNYTAIIGGFDVNGGVGSWSRSVGSTTAFDGDIGVVGDRDDNSWNIFSGAGTGVDNTAVLYGAEIRNANADGSSDSGGGMYNDGISPTIVKATFINNYATVGGGMYNVRSSTLVINSSFVNNVGTSSGGGMYNRMASPLLVNVTFANNAALRGGGGGIYNESSSPTLINITMMNNKDIIGAGGIRSEGKSKVGDILVNSIFWANTTDGRLNQIVTSHILTIAESVLEGGVSGISGGGQIIDFGIVTGSPNLGPLSGSGDSRYIPIPTGSTAVNIGYHVKVDGTGTDATLYYSEDNSTWYTTITSSGLADSVTPPDSAISLTTYDATGQERTGRPDAGAYEAR